MLSYTKQPPMEMLLSYMNLSAQEMQEHKSLIINALDTEHTIVFWNNRCEEYFGIKRDAALGKKFEDLFPQFTNDERMINLKKAFGGHHVVRLDRYATSKKYYKQRLVPVKNGDGEVIAVLNIVQDILNND